MNLETYKENLNNPKHDPLPKDEMNAMLMQWHQTKDEKLLRVIIERNTRLIFSVINKVSYSTNPATIFEFIGEGEEALFNAILKYKEVKIDFGYYAYVHITNAIRSYMRKKQSVVKSSMVKHKRMYATIEPLDALDDHQSTEDREIDTNKLLSLIDGLDEKQRNKEILIYYYGIKSGKRKTCIETAKHFNLTAERISQINIRIIKKIKASKKTMKLFSQLMWD